MAGPGKPGGLERVSGAPRRDQERPAWEEAGHLGETGCGADTCMLLALAGRWGGPQPGVLR